MLRKVPKALFQRALLASRESMGKSFRAILLIAIATGSLAASQPRRPNGRWVVNFDDAQCVASRDYGKDADPLFLVVKSPPLGNVIQVGVIRPAKGGEAEQIDAQVTIDQRPPLRTSMLAFTAKKERRRAYWINLSVDEFAPAKTAKVIGIQAERELRERFAISAMEPLMKVMDECVADLRRVWNISQRDVAPSNLKTPVSGDLSGVLRSQDYPAVALARGQGGTVALALLLDETGRVADCSVVETSGVASLDSQSCALIKERARFTPAIGLDGKPAKSSFFQRITWRTF